MLINQNTGDLFLTTHVICLLAGAIMEVIQVTHLELATTGIKKLL